MERPAPVPVLWSRPPRDTDADDRTDRTVLRPIQPGRLGPDRLLAVGPAPGALPRRTPPPALSRLRGGAARQRLDRWRRRGAGPAAVAADRAIAGQPQPRRRQPPCCGGGGRS